MAEDRSNRLRELRRAADLTQEELARAAGIHPAHLSDLERGKYSPTLETATALANALHVTVEALFLAGKSGTPPDDSVASAAPPEPGSALLASTPTDGTSGDDGVAK